MIRRFGESVKSGQSYTLRPGAYGILMRDRQILLTHQSAPVPEFQLPGGGIDPGEGAITALHREVFEETGWAIARPIRIGAFRRFTYMPEYDLWAEKLCTVYAARPVIQRGLPSEPGHQAVWMTPENAVARLGNDGDRYFLQRFLQSGNR
ncbi:NUDIX hydrolase [Thioclava sp.]|uniref:NUDIX hydrolase n=1 Tax=Thioclava sp. TaxID=1933450 RepID=UPI003AA987D8